MTQERHLLKKKKLCSISLLGRSLLSLSLCASGLINFFYSLFYSFYSLFNSLFYSLSFTKNKINKLRRDLTDVRGQVKLGMQADMATTLGHGEEKQLLETTLMNVSELSEQLSILASENDTLVQKLRRAHTELEAFKKGTAAVGANIPPSTARQDRDFMEGAAWFGRNAVHTTDRLSASISQILSELRKQVGNDDVAEDIMNQLEIVVRQCRDRMRRLFEGTLEDNVVPSNTTNNSQSLHMDSL